MIILMGTQEIAEDVIEKWKEVTKPIPETVRFRGPELSPWKILKYNAN